MSRLRNFANRVAASTVLFKVAKHIALLVCLLIIGRATGKTTADPAMIFILVVIAAWLHAVGLRLQRRSRPAA